MTYSKYKRGSEWRKWDLHVHSLMPDRFEKNPNEFRNKWKQFKSQLKGANCKVVGINDYFSVVGYKKIKEEIENKTFDIGGRVIMPVIEMRMNNNLQHRNTTTNSGTNINFHIIFDNNIHVDDIEKFINSLEYDQDTTGSNCEDMVVSFNETIRKLENNFKNKFLIWLPYDEYGGIDGINSKLKSDRLIKGGFIRKAHILGSADEKEIAFFLWQDPQHKQKEYREWFGNKKPCIKGSDSHDYSYPIGKLQDKDSQPTEKFCWIKADPTFEGLRQIVYEPEDRVKIQSSKPEEKLDYQLIDKVEFIGDLFSSEEIFINQNLTTIIGGKSTGKSLLLRSIAETINPQQVSERLKEAGLVSKYENIDTDIIVTWRDNQQNQKNKTNRVEKRIIYIPQSYLNRLVESEEDKTAIDDIINKVIKQEDTIKKVLSNLDSSNKQVETILMENIDKLFYTRQLIQEASESIRNMGDRIGIEKEIYKLDQEISELQKVAGMSNEDRSEYKSLMKKILDLREEQQMITQYLVQLNDLLRLPINFKANNVVRSMVSAIPLEVRRLLSEELDSILGNAETSWRKVITDKYRKLKKQRESNITKLGSLIQEVEPLQKKVKNSNLFREKKEKIEEQQQKLRMIIGAENILGEFKSERDYYFNKICDSCLDFYNNFNIAKKGILKQHSITRDQNLQFDVEVVFRSKAFQEECINNVYDRKRQNQTEETSLQDYKFLDINSFKNGVEEIIQATLEEKLLLGNRYSRKEAITKLTQNWFRLNYKIKQDGDEISQMSLGKRSLVLLKLLIDLDNSKWPILLDQPEDDLDNRSIYHDLVKFIKSKKRDRQIIIVTHNPNLVVGADAECVIVANQSSAKSKNKEYQFEYVQGSLEHTFSDRKEKGILYKQGIQGHVCEILEGGEEAFRVREQKYGLDS